LIFERGQCLGNLLEQIDKISQRRGFGHISVGSGIDTKSLVEKIDISWSVERIEVEIWNAWVSGVLRTEFRTKSQ
jgi:hypothetical protein